MKNLCLHNASNHRFFIHRFINEYARKKKIKFRSPGVSELTFLKCVYFTKCKQT